MATFFATNIGSLDRSVRVIGGAALVGLTAAGILPVWGYIGIVPLLTGLTRTCPAYSLLGMSTCPNKTSTNH